MKNKKNNLNEIPEQNMRPKSRKILIRIKSDSNMTRVFIVKSTSTQML